jgi:sulfite reductase (ferredoxin)
VSPYAHALFSYFLRKPFGQELGRKIKIAFSNNDKDTAVTYIHDIGFIPKLNEAGERGFKVLIGWWFRSSAIFSSNCS